MKKLIFSLAGMAVLSSAFSQFAQGELVVKFKPGREQAGLARVGGTVVERIPQLGVARVRLSNMSAQVSTQIGVLLNSGDAEYAHPNFIAQKFVVPNDPFYTKQWHHKMINSERAWNKGQSAANIKIAILDTGVDLDHPDLVANMLPGFDFADNDNNPDDMDGHGTHCAGIAAAVGNNGVGVAGMAWRAKILPVRVLGTFGGSFFDIAQGIIYAADQRANVISMSLGGRSAGQVVQDALRYALGKGSLPIAAAGNDGGTNRNYPAGYDECIAVASTNEADQKSGFSTWGPDWVDVAAPGSNIESTFPGGYGLSSGTSMACPLVSGLAAVVWANMSGANATTVRRRIESTCDFVGNFVTFGRINADRAVPLPGTSGVIVWNPSAVTRFEGASHEGAVPELSTSDNRYLTVLSTPVLRTGQAASLRITFTADRAISTVTDLNLKLELAAVSGVSANLFLWNYRTSRFDFITVTNLTGTDTTRDIRFPANVADYFNASRQAVLIVRGIRPVGMGSNPAAYTLRADRTVITAVPRS